MIGYPYQGLVNRPPLYPPHVKARISCDVFRGHTAAALSIGECSNDVLWMWEGPGLPVEPPLPARDPHTPRHGVAQFDRP